MRSFDVCESKWFRQIQPNNLKMTSPQVSKLSCSFIHWVEDNEMVKTTSNNGIVMHAVKHSASVRQISKWDIVYCAASTFDPDLYQTNLWDYLCLHCFRDADLIGFNFQVGYPPASAGWRASCRWCAFILSCSVSASCRSGSGWHNLGNSYKML